MMNFSTDNDAIGKGQATLGIIERLISPHSTLTQVHDNFMKTHAIICFLQMPQCDKCPPHLADDCECAASPSLYPPLTVDALPGFWSLSTESIELGCFAVAKSCFDVISKGGFLAQHGHR